MKAGEQMKQDDTIILTGAQSLKSPYCKRCFAGLAKDAVDEAKRLNAEKRFLAYARKAALDEHNA